jgi:plasmid stabilization system protein ParE
VTNNDAAADMPPRYAIRILPVALNEIDSVAAYLDAHGAVADTEEWRAGLRKEIARLATVPRQFPIIAEAHMFRREVRQILYRRTASSSPYRVLFSVSDAGDDGPQVTVFHVRHAARRPISRREARDFGRSL